VILDMGGRRKQISFLREVVKRDNWKCNKPLRLLVVVDVWAHS
jgi:hypothetical protein